MMRFLIAATALFCAVVGHVQAGDVRVPGMLSNDVYYTEAGLKKRLVGNVILYADGSEAVFRRNGKYLFRKTENGKAKTGEFIFRPMGMVCVRFDAGGTECGTYVRSTRTTYFLTSGGGRRKVKAMVRE